ncbi:MAG TPA: hypothetical protein VJ302_33525 [Blastocatellia bacterium]|nr:hypothetical protein [Blastocatellia bacterium]
MSRIESSQSKSGWKLWIAAALLCLGLTALAVLPFFVLGEATGAECCGGTAPMTHDGVMHLNQMQSFWRGLTSGRIYPRWDDATHFGYGAPNPIFYPPGVYYLSSLCYWILGEWEQVLIVLQLVLMAASGLAIYWYARQSMSGGASIVAMAVYIVAPYHLLNQYQRGALAEQLSFIWMPLALLAGERLFAEEARNRIPTLVGLTAVMGAFLFSHPPTAYQFILIFGLCAAVIAIRTRRWGWLIMIGIAIVVGSLVAAAYLFPAFVEQNLIKVEEVGEIWPYHASYVFDFGQTIYDHTYDDFTIRLDRIWTFNAVAILLIGSMVVGLRRQLGSDRLLSRVWFWSAAGVLALFFMTTYSYPIGRFIPKIEIGVFSWRMLSITSLVLALLAGAGWQAAGELLSRRRAVSILAGAASLLVVIAAGAMTVWYVAKPMYRAEAFSPDPTHFNRATLPKGVPFEVPEMGPALLASGGGRIAIDRIQPEFRQYRVELVRADQLHIRTSKFPGWTALVDGRVTEVKAGESGQMVIELPVGSHQVTLDFRSTPVRRLCNWMTVISTALLISIYLLSVTRAFHRLRPVRPESS